MLPRSLRRNLRLLRAPWLASQAAAASTGAMTSAVQQRWAQAHDNPNGPGDARPSALQIIEDEGLMGKLQGLVFLVTGGSSGLGFETVRALHAAGADVILPVRSLDKGEAMVADVRASGSRHGATGWLQLYKADLSSLASVRKCAEQILIENKRLNVMINNAGARQLHVQPAPREFA